MDGTHYPFSDQFSLCFLWIWMLESKFKLSLLSFFPGGHNPQTYKHSLPTTSVLRHTVERLYAYTKSSQPTTNRQLVTLVKIENTGAQRKQLPPLQWSALLSPLMRCAGENGWYQWFDTCIEILTLSEGMSSTISFTATRMWIDFDVHTFWKIESFIIWMNMND